MQPITRFSEVTVFDAITAWEQWNLTEYTFKSECLLSVWRYLEKEQPELSSIIKYHLHQADERLAEPKLMPGPTGETNELYCAGRGVCALIVENNTSWAAVMAMLTAALITGNSVVICCDDIDLNKVIESAISTALPAHVVQIVAYDSYQEVIKSDIRITAFIGSDVTQMSINRLLAESEGVITPLVAETVDGTSTSGHDLVLTHDPSLVLSFITERTRTINITAVGGNATLLELGDQH